MGRGRSAGVRQAGDVPRPWPGGPAARHGSCEWTGVAAATGHLLTTSPHTGIIGPPM
jgi:hypothetical protein